MADFKKIFEDLASGRPAKKPVSGNLLKQRAKENEKALKSGFMKMPDYVKKKFNEEEVKPHKMYKGDKVVVAKNKAEHDKLNKQGYTHDDPKTKKVEESTRDNYNPVVAKLRNKEKMKKVGLPAESPLVKEQSIFEISDSLKKRFLAKAGKQITSKEKMKDYQLGQMDKQKDKPASLPREKFTKADKEFVKNKYDKDTLKRRKGMAQARSKLGEAKKPVVHSDKPDSLKKMVKIKLNPNKKIGVKVTDIGPGGKEYVRKNTMQEQQIQIVTNLDFNEGLTNLVSRGLDKVRSSIKDAEKRTGLSVDASKNNKNNPVSGDNIRKRLESQKKRKK